MACTSPRTVGFLADGTTLTWSSQNYSREFSTFQLPCGKCLSCRLEYARQWAVRCVHEAQMHKESCFITLTYEKLESPKLVYEDFQKFMKKLRKLQNEPIGVFVTGEYGDQTKRPHWHALIFGWRPRDIQIRRTTDRGDKAYSSETLKKTWGLGHCELGDVTIHSAGYCARYAAKKLVHGKDHEHEYQPISKKSSKHAIGKKWIQKHWEDVFTDGKLILHGGKAVGVPRYYEKWFKENHPEKWAYYVTEIKPRIIEKVESINAKDRERWLKTFHSRRDRGFSRPLTSIEVKKILQEHRFQTLQNYLKLK